MSGMTDETFRLPTLEDELEELRAVGVEITGDRLAGADQDAAANQLLRAMAALQLEVDRLDAAERRAVTLAARHYEGQREPVRRRMREIEAVVLELARSADFGGQRKSRGLVYGTYGRRQVVESVKIVDAAEAIAWCKANYYGFLVQTETVEKLPHKDAQPHFLARIIETGDVPAGVEHVPARDEPYIRVDAELLAVERGEEGFL